MTLNSNFLARLDVFLLLLLVCTSSITSKSKIRGVAFRCTSKLQVPNFQPPQSTEPEFLAFLTPLWWSNTQHFQALGYFIKEKRSWNLNTKYRHVHLLNTSLMMFPLNFTMARWLSLLYWESLSLTLGFISSPVTSLDTEISLEQFS